MKNVPKSDSILFCLSTSKSCCLSSVVILLWFTDNQAKTPYKAVESYTYRSRCIWIIIEKNLILIFRYYFNTVELDYFNIRMNKYEICWTFTLTDRSSLRNSKIVLYIRQIKYSVFEYNNTQIVLTYGKDHIVHRQGNIL